MLLITLLHAFLSLFPSVEREKEIAYEGTIVLETNEIVTGLFYFEEKMNLLYKRKQTGLEIFPIYKVKALYFYDARENINRRYIKLANDKSRSNLPNQLYEVVLGGELKVLRKRKAYDFPVKVESPGLNKAEENAYNYHYFIQFNEDLLEICDFSKKVLPHMRSQHPRELDLLLKEQDWNVHQASGAIQLIEEYNQLNRL